MTFTETYEKHVAAVQANDVKAIFADIQRDARATILDGVTAPQGGVVGTDIVRAEIVATDADGAEAVGECRYDLGTDVIGLRSYWRQDGDRWLAYRLENFG